ncbi:MAG: alpha amylase C-terminal domain-containing protein, partial [Oscillospiraceae bacterium]|nr:alpha amylase C-terminal domain-containing protein [Oscillospiraceae bacterium]
KKLNFMGTELGQVIEWDYKKELDWMLLQYPQHEKMHRFFRDINHFYLDNSPLWKNDDSWDGFKWISADDYTQSIIAFRRIDMTDRENPKEIIVVCNFVPVTRTGYCIGVPYDGVYEQVLCTDDLKYGGSGEVENGRIKARSVPMHGCDHSISITIPGLSAIYFSCTPAPKPEVIDVEPIESTPAPKPKRSRKKAAPAEAPAQDKDAADKPKRTRKPKADADKKDAAEKKTPRRGRKTDKSE